MKKKTFNGKVENGELVIDREALVKSLPYFEGCEVEIIIEEVHPIKSDRQHRFYFGPFLDSEIACFKERFGTILTKSQAHEFNKSNFLHEERFSPLTGEIIKIPRSSMDNWETMEWEERVEMMRQYFHTNFNWTLPVPNELPHENNEH